MTRQQKKRNFYLFSNTVIPMLPEEISNDLCSLVPNKIRNVVVSDITFDTDGEIKIMIFMKLRLNQNTG